FTYPDGSRIGPTRSLGDRFHAVATRAGVRRLTVHDVRHTHASLLLRRGVALNVVSRRLGHANEAITLTTYAHLLRGQSRDAADVAAVIAAVRG
ncbi:MAG: tyrosine-type recombinase/integrase, partial [Actinomycetota bacterium]